ncbi:hypothetical protein JHW45_04535 [Paracoccus stylophorae]|uniref:Cytochrome C oxidase assembly protein n=1 Tax=Paracoccus stylophorae TaxID=659350 RepID=A0ABY7SXX0_9RHOB|nr:hypothetical protein [Paracoccus stylophorae]WCR11650.1 hypothetical protein JHW45_04535 [Paracoccus stylophorae]
MAMQSEHDLHRRRRSRNVGLGLVLAAFVALVFGLTIVKVRQGDMLEAYDHQPRVSVLPSPAEPATPTVQEGQQ